MRTLVALLLLPAAPCLAAPQTKLPVRSIVYRTVDGKSREVYCKDYSDWVVDKPINPSTFQFTPPTGAKEVPSTP